MIKKITDFCKSLGLNTLGFIPCREFTELIDFYSYRKINNLENEFEEKDIKKRINPNIYMEDGKTIISIAFPYYNVTENIENGFSIYTKTVDYHKVINKYLTEICMFIESLSGKARGFVDSNALPERYIAYLAGVGFIGKNNMIITKEYGSFVFLGEIITNLEIDCQDKRSFNEIGDYLECNNCSICINQCPTKAINNNKRNSNICLSYITQKKHIINKEIKLLKGNVFGCDFCQNRCPYNQNLKGNILKDFIPLDFMMEDIATFAKMDNSFFKEKVKITSCGWRGKNIIKRNAIIRLKYKGEDITQFKGDSQYINEYIELLSKDD